MWLVMAVAAMGDGDGAMELFHLLNPVNHTRGAADLERYKTEPYVVAADIVTNPSQPGRGGWTWYTGSAAWMYRAGLESILGVRLDRGDLVVEPCIPASWPGFRATIRRGRTRYDIVVENPGHLCRGVREASRDGVVVPDSRVPLPDDGGTHVVRIVMGTPAAAAAARVEPVQAALR
jgi:cyclic beta-1,2-glucan synthetase